MSKLFFSLVLAVAFFVAAAFPDFSQASTPAPQPIQPAQQIQQQDFGNSKFIMGDGAHKRAMLAAEQDTKYAGK